MEWPEIKNVGGRKKRRWPMAGDRKWSGRRKWKWPEIEKKMEWPEKMLVAGKNGGGRWPEIENGGDVNAAYHTGQMALHWSVVRGAIQVADQEGAHRRYVLQAFEAASLNYFSEILRSTCNARATLEDPNSKLLWRILLLKKFNFISCEPMAHILDIKLIRTDTTLDLSQKAEKESTLFIFFHFILSPWQLEELGWELFQPLKSSSTFSKLVLKFQIRTLERIAAADLPILAVIYEIKQIIRRFFPLNQFFLQKRVTVCYEIAFSVSIFFMIIWSLNDRNNIFLINKQKQRLHGPWVHQLVSAQVTWPNSQLGVGKPETATQWTSRFQQNNSPTTSKPSLDFE
ncbi:hypothetical protein LguiA_033803 [Lonicera macranthoides]